MRFGRLARVLGRNKISWNPRTLTRVLFLLQSSLWSEIFAVVENLYFGKHIKNLPCPQDPVFIIGHWRTGTTLLFKLMSLDEQFTAPTLFQVAEPDSMLTSHSYYKPIMKALVNDTRPMDNVRMGMDEPQEDEYAIYRLTGDSPLERLVFPRHETYFLQEWAQKMTAFSTEEAFEAQIKNFFTKLRFHKQGTILSKNPFHSFRLLTLLRIFPGARVIQIHRHPFNVVPSTINMWDILQKENALNNDLHKHDVQEICRVMNILNEKITAGIKALPERNYAEIMFEDLEKDPVTVIRQLYSALGLDFSEQLERKIVEYMTRNLNFKKNSFTLSENEKTLISSELKDYMRKYSYS